MPISNQPAALQCTFRTEDFPQYITHASWAPAQSLLQSIKNSSSYWFQGE